MPFDIIHDQPRDFDAISARTAERMRSQLGHPPTAGQLAPRPRLKVYLAGPMRGVPAYNFPAFHAAAAKLRTEGYEVFNPAEEDVKRTGFDPSSNAAGIGTEEERAAGLTIRECLAHDLDWICRHADAIALLPGWQASKGACAEYSTAQALGLRAIFLEEIK